MLSFKEIWPGEKCTRKQRAGRKRKSAEFYSAAFITGGDSAGTRLTGLKLLAHM